jgi:tripeptidyl-peptidase-1
VTGVGATQIGKGKSVDDPEGAAEEGWAGISSGGGFSIIYDAPWYQKAALSRYFEVSNNVSDLPYYENGKYRGNKGIYNRNGRGIPDLSASEFISNIPSPHCFGI